MKTASVNDAGGALIAVTVNPTQHLYEIGQSLWLDNITRAILNDGTLESYVRDFSVTGLTSNPSIFDEAIEQSTDYDDSIREAVGRGVTGEDLFFELAIQDLQRAADQFRPIYDRTEGVDGWVSLEVSPLLANDADSTTKEAAALHERARRDNVLIKIPGTAEGARAIEESIFAGVPINVTLLFSHEQYLVAAEGFMRGIERRINAGLDPSVPSVASVFISRWDKAVAGKIPRRTPRPARHRGRQACLCRVSGAPRLRPMATSGQRRRPAATAPLGEHGHQDPAAPDVLYVEALAAPFTINTIPDKTLKAFAEHGNVGELMPVDGGDAEEVLAQFARAGIDRLALAAQLQRDGAEAFDESWESLLASIDGKT